MSTGRQAALSLYRSILRAHRLKLPAELRKLGDEYVKREFLLHRDAKPSFLPSFFSEWRAYVSGLEAAPGSAGVGRDLDEGAIAAMNDEQKAQLEALKREAANAVKNG